MTRTDDIGRTRDISARALDHLARADMGPTPRNYELFYTYVAGRNKSVVSAITQAVATCTTLSDSDVEAILDAHVPRARLSGEAEKIGAQMSDEIAEITHMIQSAVQSTGDFGQAMESLTEQINKITTPTQLRFVVTTIVDTTTEMAQNSRKLETRLTESKRQIDDLHQRLETTRAEALTDELTGLANRKRVDQIMEMEIGEAAESGEPLCLIVADIDHFKIFNDTYGHQTGDQVLRLVAQTIKAGVKAGDHAGRYGGEEFCVLLPRTSLRDAAIVAERLRSAVRSRELVKKSTGEVLGHITLSLGVAQMRVGESGEALFSRADQCLYAAKRGGRDQVTTESDASCAEVSAA